MIPVDRLFEAHLPVAHLETSIAFYRDRVGLELAHVEPVYFQDPDGHLLEYVAMIADEPRPHDGVVTWREWSVARVLRRRR